MVDTLDFLEKPRWRIVEQKANTLSEDYSRPPIPALEIAQEHGVEVVFADFAEQSEDVAGFCDFAKARLYVNRNDPETRQTFTIAHELGHWILHKKYFKAHPDKYEILPRFQSVVETDAFEKEANFFAASLLVPKRLLKPVQGASATSLATAFAVSRKMMEFRLRNV